MDKDLQSVQEVRDLIRRAKQAEPILAAMTQAQLDAICAAISKAGLEHARRLGRMAVEETGFGIPEDKELKNQFAAGTVYEAIKDQKTMEPWISECRWAWWRALCPPPIPPLPSCIKA